MDFSELLKKASLVDFTKLRNSTNAINRFFLKRNITKTECDISPVDIVFNDRINKLEESGSQEGADITALKDDVTTLKSSVESLDVQVDYSQTDETAKDYIKNKPLYDNRTFILNKKIYYYDILSDNNYYYTSKIEIDVEDLLTGFHISFSGEPYAGKLEYEGQVYFDEYSDTDYPYRSNLIMLDKNSKYEMFIYYNPNNKRIKISFPSEIKSYYRDIITLQIYTDYESIKKISADLLNIDNETIYVDYYKKIKARIPSSLPLKCKCGNGVYVDDTYTIEVDKKVRAYLPDYDIINGEYTYINNLKGEVTFSSDTTIANAVEFYGSDWSGYEFTRKSNITTLKANVSYDYDIKTCIYKKDESSSTYYIDVICNFTELNKF